MAVSGAAAEAAEFTVLQENPHRCAVKISGPIETGDLDRFKAFVRDEVTPLGLPVVGGAQSVNSGPHPMICLDSPGGSLAEAVRMALYIKEGYSEEEGTFILRNMATMVAAGDKCHSACAVLFLAGQSSEGQHGNFPARNLHVGGELAFHAPSLDVPSGDYSKESVDKAFRLAVQAISQLMSRADTLELSPKLIDQMLSVPPEVLGYLDTVGAAQAYGVDLVGLPVPQGLTRDRVGQLCDMARRPGAALSLPTVGRSSTVPDFYRIYTGMDRTWNRFEEEGRTVRFEMGIFDEGGYTCSGELGRTEENELWGRALIDDWGGGQTSFSAQAEAWKFYPPQVPLRELAAIMNGRDALTADVTFPEASATMQTTCTLLAGGTVTAKEPCTVSFQQVFYGDATRSYIWEANVAGEAIRVTGRERRGQDTPTISLNGAVATVAPALGEGAFDTNPRCVGTPERAFCFETGQ
ncbi:hypothetical protein PGB28_00365 [Primorskyibacter aestuariivivens]|uniref:hypothetical protein n=1 Tax=Primorskyibacter aestuariivivens TaxID=1888912 RepID=UPI002301DE89|nr:hypothetical protein [Primorskyibacter aestuariivivens]MDA7426892.1 hypothetical protein [Primorskyibacter aestuariivivens]